MDTFCVNDVSRPSGRANKLWYALDEAAQQLDMKPRAINRRLIPMSYHPEPRRGQIRFRVMGAPQRITRLWWEDVLAKIGSTP